MFPFADSVTSCQLSFSGAEAADQMQHRNATSWSVYTYIIRGTSHESRLYFLANHARCFPLFILARISIDLQCENILQKIISAWYMHVHRAGRGRATPTSLSVNCLGRPLVKRSSRDFRKCWKLNYFCDNHHQLCGTRLQTPRPGWLECTRLPRLCYPARWGGGASNFYGQFHWF